MGPNKIKTWRRLSSSASVNRVHKGNIEGFTWVRTESDLKRPTCTSKGVKPKKRPEPQIRLWWRDERPIWFEHCFKCKPNCNMKSTNKNNSTLSNTNIIWTLFQMQDNLQFEIDKQKEQLYINFENKYTCLCFFVIYNFYQQLTHKALSLHTTESLCPYAQENQSSIGLSTCNSRTTSIKKIIR